MKHKLIKLSDTHYVVVDDSEIKEGDFVIDKHKNIYQQLTDKVFEQFTGSKKISHSTQPLGIGWQQEVIELSLSEVEEIIYRGSAENMAQRWATSVTTRSTDYWRTLVEGYVEGFNAHRELVKDKLFTVNDLRKAIASAWSSDNKTMGEIIQSLLPKTEWDIKFNEQGKIVLL